MIRSLALAAILWGGAAALWADEPADAPPRHSAVAPMGKYFIGVACSPVPPVLREHLPLDEGVGVMVASVLPDSPAAKAGIEPFDVLVRVADKPIHSAAELTRMIDESGDKDLHVVLIHEGKEAEVDVKPAQRPAGAPGEVPPVFRDPEEAARWFGQFWPDASRSGMRLRFFHPGMILPDDAPAHSPLPKNLSVTIAKQGDQPAEIRIERGDEKWTVKENELDQLPNDVRPHVERMLNAQGRGRGGAVLGFAPDWGALPPGKAGDTPADLAGRRAERLERQLREVKERLDRITDELSQLQKDEASAEKPEKE